MVLLDFEKSSMSADDALERLDKRGIRIGHGRGEVLRAVFHLDLSGKDVEEAIAVFSEEFE